MSPQGPTGHGGVQQVRVPTARFTRWVENFQRRHGAAHLVVDGGALCGTAEDESTFRATLPLGASYSGAAGLEEFVAAAQPPAGWGVLLVRKGGFAVARMERSTMVEHKIGQRHVQGRTRAGGQSQQRFARRRDNQARHAYEAAAEHAVRILRPGPVVVGGDRPAVDAVLDDPRLRGLAPVGDWLAVADPRRSVLDGAIEDALAVGVHVVNA